MASREEMDERFLELAKSICDSASAAIDYFDSDEDMPVGKVISLSSSATESSMGMLMEVMNNVRLAQQETTDEIRALRLDIEMSRRSRDEQG